MNLFTIGFTKKTARQFFGLLKDNKIDIVVDIRLNNKSQLAGFTKGDDLKYFLAEICNCEYAHCDEYAPTKVLLDEYKKGKVSWDYYVETYIPLIQRRNGVHSFLNRFSQYNNVCLLCSEPTPEQCHRRLLAEMIQKETGASLKHII